LAVLGSALFYGSYFAPVKRYEVHDGLVFQWYQCSGVLLGGLVCALLRNDWSAHGEQSNGFYVAPEGLLSGALLQLANITATFSVKAVGLGTYYTMHQVTNLGLSFVVGIFGADLGLPAKKPHSVTLAFLGFFMVLLGITPVMFMTKEVSPDCNEDAMLDASMAMEAATCQANATASAAATNTSGAAGTDCGDLSAATASTSSAPNISRSLLTAPKAQARDLQQNPSFSRQSSSFSSDTRPHPAHSFCSDADCPISFVGCASMVIPEVSENSAEGSQAPASQRTSCQWIKGILLALLAGLLYSSLYVPLLPWKRRMREDCVQVQGFDSFFAMSVGFYVASTAWMLCGGAWKTYQRQRMARPVLRPALASGLIYAAASFSFLFSLMLLPYAVGYALGVGGGLAVSLAWSTFVFGEASSPHNRRCVGASFAGMLFGIVLLGLSA